MSLTDDSNRRWTIQYLDDSDYFTLHSFGLNHYSTKWATGKKLASKPNPFEFMFGDVNELTSEDAQGRPIGVRGHNGHPYTVPWGFRSLLKYIHDTWTGEKGIPIYITENGFAGQDEGKKSLSGIVDDKERQDYFEGYLHAMLCAIKEDKVSIKGYFGWSLLE